MPARATVLVTRSRPGALGLARKLAAAGFDPLVCPPLRLEATEHPAITAAALRAALPVDVLIITSPFALDQTISLLGPDLLAETPVVVPGPGTAARARRLGLKRALCPSHGSDSEAMLALPVLRAVRGRRVLILAAAGGRQRLARTLTGRGAEVSSCLVYRRLAEPLPWDLPARIAAASILVTLAASAAALLGLWRQLDGAGRDRLAKAPVIVPSRRVARLARRLGCQLVTPATGADDAALLAALARITSADGLR